MKMNTLQEALDAYRADPGNHDLAASAIARLAASVLLGQTPKAECEDIAKEISTLLKSNLPPELLEIVEKLLNKKTDAPPDVLAAAAQHMFENGIDPDDAGCGLVMGCDVDGGTVGTSFPLAYIAAAVSWTDQESSGDIEPGGEGTVEGPDGTPWPAWIGGPPILQPRGTHRDNGSRA